MIGRAAGWAAVSLLSVAVLLSGFAPGSGASRVALGALVFSAAAGILAPEASAAALCFFAPIAAGVSALFGASAAGPWPALLVLGLGSGWLFRRMTRADEAKDAVRGTDRSLAALAVLWILSAAAAAVSARSPWALVHGVAPRVVNVQGMEDASAIRDAVLTLGSVFAGLVLYAASRKFSNRGRRRIVSSLLAGGVLTCVAALLQWRGFLAAPRAPFWVSVGRFQGFASDPNALGVLAGVILPVCIGKIFEGKRPAVWIPAAAAVAVALSVSGSRSGLAAAVIGVALAAWPRLRAPSNARRRAQAAALLAVLAVGLLLVSRSPGSLAGRMTSLFDAKLAWFERVSSRPLLWETAWSAWKSSPLSGIGWNAFSWNLPNIAARKGVTLSGYDNPGNFYLQVLCETGLVGALLLALFLAGASGRIRAALSAPAGEENASSRAAAAAAAGLLAALATGSHLLAVEVSIAFFLLFAELPAVERSGAPTGGFAAVLLALAAAGYAFFLIGRRSPAESFRYSPRIGFYAEERDPEGAFRWTAARAAIWLAPGARASGVLLFENPVESRENLRVESEGRLLFERAMRQGEPVRLRLSAPADRGSALLFENSAWFRPSSFGRSADGRELALRVRLNAP